MAENPIRHGTLPANIVEVTQVLLDAGAEGRDYALGARRLRAGTARVRSQLDLIDVLVDARRGPELPRSRAGAPRERRRGAAAGARRADTLVAAACLGREFDAAAATPEERQVAFAGAALHGRADALRELIAAGVEINAFNPPGYHAHSTALHSAVDSGSAEAVEVLVAAGADRTIKDTLFDATPTTGSST